VAARGMRLRPACLARARREDVRLVADLAQGAGIPIEVGLFMHTSPIHQFVHGWSEDDQVRMLEAHVGLAAGEGLPVTFVSEDAARSHPRTLARLAQAAMR